MPKKESEIIIGMRKTHWNLIMAGAFGGALIMLSTDLVTSFTRPLNYILSIFAVILGAGVIAYARYS